MLAEMLWLLLLLLLLKVQGTLANMLTRNINQLKISQIKVASSHRM